MRTAQQMIDEAEKASVKALGGLNAGHMIGSLAGRLAEALNELDAYSVPPCERGNRQVAFVHQGLHLVAEYNDHPEGDGEVLFVWLGSDDILPLLGSDDPEFVREAIDRDIAEGNERMATCDAAMWGAR